MKTGTSYTVQHGGSAATAFRHGLAYGSGTRPEHWDTTATGERSSSAVYSPPEPAEAADLAVTVDSTGSPWHDRAVQLTVEYAVAERANLAAQEAVTDAHDALTTAQRTAEELSKAAGRARLALDTHLVPSAKCPRCGSTEPDTSRAPCNVSAHPYHDQQA